MTVQSADAVIGRICGFFAGRGLEAWLVGGAVRDRLLGRVGVGGDVDLAVVGDVWEVGQGLAGELGGTLVPLSPQRGIMRVVVGGRGDGDVGGDGGGNAGAYAGIGAGTGLGGGAGAYAGIGAGTGLGGGAGAGAGIGAGVSAGMGAGAGGGLVVDFTCFSGDIGGDLGRRDFTVNAMAAPLGAWVGGGDFAAAVVDPFGGRGDLGRRTLRAVSAGIFEEDPGRLLRAVRLSGELGLRIEPATARLVRDGAHLLPLAHPVRVRDEFLRAMAPLGARGRVEAMDRLGLLEYVVPELTAGKGVGQPGMHYWDVWGHSLQAVEAAEGVTGGHRHSPVYSCVPWTADSAARFGATVMHGHSRRTMLKLAALFHDIAKPQTKTVEADGRVRFLGHAELGAEVTQGRLLALGFSGRSAGRIARMVRHHLRPFNMAPPGKWPGRRAIFRYFRELGDEGAVDTLYLSLADYLATKGPELAHPEWLDYARMVGHTLYVGSDTGPAGAAKPRLVNGREVMSRFGLAPGPRVGELLAAIEEARAAGEIETQEQALELAAGMLGDGGQGRGLPDGGDDGRDDGPRVGSG